MGVYDMLPKGSQVKLWECELHTKKIGDAVANFSLPEYIVLLREGGFVRVKDGIITEIRENSRLNYYPEDFPGTPCFDKYGGRVDTYEDLVGELQGIAELEDPYYFRSK